MAQVPYNPVPQQTPNGAPIPLRNTNVSGDTFGANVGQAVQGLGASIGQAANVATDIEVKQQGMVRETEATDAKTQFEDQKSQILGEYRSKEGMDAYTAQNDAKKALEQARLQVRSTLKDPLTQQAYDTLTRNQLGDAFQDVNMYGASQLKTAHTNAFRAATQNAITEAGSLTTASYPLRFNRSLGNIDFNVRAEVQGAGWGKFMHEDPTTHALTFDKSPDGENAQAVYQATLNESFGKAYEARFHTLADVNVTSAYEEYKKDRADIPGSSQVALDNFFAPKVRSAQAAATADSVITDADKNYLTLQDGIAKTNDPSASVGDTFLPVIEHVEHSDAAAKQAGVSVDEVTSPKGAVGKYQVMPDTAKQYGFDPAQLKNPEYNKKVASAVLNDLSQRYRKPDGSVDTEAVLVAYNAGPGRANDWLKNGRNDASLPQETQNYLADYRKNVAPSIASQAGNPTPGQSKANYYRTHYDDILANAEAKAQTEHPDDPTYSDLARARVQQQLNSAIHAEDAANTAAQATIYQAMSGSMTKGARPTTPDQLMAVSPEVKQAWQRLQQNAPQTAFEIEKNVLPANAGGAGGDLHTYGPEYYHLFSRLYTKDADKITAPEQLYQYLGTGLTNAGLDKLTERLTHPTPGGIAETQMMQSTLARARQMIAPTFPGVPIRPDQELQFERFQNRFFDDYNAGRAAGKTPTQLLGPDSPDYIGKSIQLFVPTKQAHIAATVNAGITPARTPATPPAPAKLSPKDQLIYDYHAKRLSYDQFKKKAIEMGLAREDAGAAPVVPIPGVTR